MSQSPIPTGRFAVTNYQSPSGFIPGPLKKLFADRHDVRFWQTEGIQHTYLFWVRATLTEAVEPPPFVPSPLNRREQGEGAPRRVAYDFLSRAWTYPTAETLAAFAAPEFSQAFTEGWTHLTGDAPGAEIFTGLSQAHLEQLRVAYTRLFYDTYVPFIPPYESVYYNERQVMGKRAAAVMEFYQRAGLVADGESPDHIAHECEFVAHLTSEEISADAAGDGARAAEIRQMQDEFLREHLLPWGMKFCADLACLAHDDFYAITARLGTALFNAEWWRITA